MAAAEDPLRRLVAISSFEDSRGLLLKHAANELVFAVVGHVGSGTSEIAESLKESLGEKTLPGGPFEVRILKARDVITEWARETKEPIPDGGRPALDKTIRFQDLGDRMRSRPTRDGESDLPAVARRLVLKIRQSRAASLGKSVNASDPVLPDGQRRAYILDSLRHPAEVHLLRHVYQDAFVLIGVVCEERRRLERLRKKYPDAGETRLREFMSRDARAEQRYGQHVAEAFHLSDFFVDNTIDRVLEHNEPNPDWDTNEKLNRLVKIVSHSAIVRPEMAEVAMHHAYGAMMQSACLSRQVGAALVDRAGNVVATGTNEVPKAGGGVYGESFTLGDVDDRCGFRRPDGRKYCSNTREQNSIIEELIASINELNALPPERKSLLAGELRRTRIGGLLEFSRAVHAEMDAILSAAREGISPVGTRLFVTTFPCHYCARHIVTAGVDEVQYIEPYPKSQALDLHDDAIQITATGWKPPSQSGKKVLFRPFSGVAPRLFTRAFLKDRDLKDKSTGVD